MKSTHPLDNENYEEAVGIIVLAAGSSSRMGQSKQLLLIGGESLLAHSLKISLATALKNVVVVLGANREDHRSVVKNFKVDVVINDQWARGMGSSIKCGLRHLLIHKQVNAVIVMVCDQPLLQPTHLQKLISKHIESKSPVVASAYADTVGVPVLFGKAIFEELLELKDSEGAKKILLRHKAISIPFPEGIIDLDHIDDYHDFIKTHKVD